MQTRRRQFLINKRFQFRFAFYVSSWLIALSLAYPLILSSFFDFFFRYLALDPMGPEISYLENSRKELLWLLIGMQVVLVTLSFVISIFMGHKIAGPLYKLGNYFREAKSGNVHQKILFRKGDYFLEVATGYNEMMQAIAKRFDTDAEVIASAASRIETLLAASTSTDPKLKNDLNAVLRGLRAAQSQVTATPSAT